MTLPTSIPLPISREQIKALTIDGRFYRNLKAAAAIVDWAKGLARDEERLMNIPLAIYRLSQAVPFKAGINYRDLGADLFNNPGAVLGETIGSEVDGVMRSFPIIAGEKREEFRSNITRWTIHRILELSQHIRTVSLELLQNKIVKSSPDLISIVNGVKGRLETLVRGYQDALIRAPKAITT